MSAAITDDTCRALGRASGLASNLERVIADMRRESLHAPRDLLAVLESARAVAREAVALDPEIAKAHRLLGLDQEADAPAETV